jgi:predicted AlkP superfamily pyrophosphatase or phosphodiesterase
MSRQSAQSCIPASGGIACGGSALWDLLDASLDAVTRIMTRTVIALGEDRRLLHSGTSAMRLRTLLLLICIACAAGCAQMPLRDAVGSARTPLILISLDGFRADYIDRGFTPTLAALAANGVRAQSMKPSFPTLTFPNHYTLVTGLYPDHHGIVDNRMTDPVSGRRFVYKEQATIEDPAWWGGEPLWVSAEKQGLRTATMFWPGSTVAIAGVRPSRWRMFDSAITPDQRVDQVLAWIDLPPMQQPAFFTVYFEQLDHAGHQQGPDSPEVDAALREVDTALARLVAGLRERSRLDRTNLVIVSDHGLAATSRERVIFIDDLLAPVDARIVNHGLLTGIEPLGDGRAAAQALLRPHDHMQCWRKSDMPKRLHYGTHPRIPALLCLAAEGWVIASHEWLAKRRHFSRGEHGYDNEAASMRALFVASGPGFRRGVVVPEFDNVDVYPLLAHLLGVQPQANDGDFAAVGGMLRNDAR